MENSREFWSVQPVIPVVVIDDEENAVPLAKALVEGGLPRIEITLRTKAALGAINKISKEVPDALVGAGTVLNQKNLKDAIESGAGYIVSPGTTAELRKALKESSIPSLPGAATVSEAMELMDSGFKVAKFFPAADSGGVNMLKSISTVLQDIAFCPTGGISLNTYKDYLALSNVVCVGGSWVAPKDLIAAKDWDAITKLAEAVSK
ncbi:MAG: hypothetical protein RL581_153 [Actinomycetota bacterium]|jgi:2-dehydro-3-deoxyphosphogluconate aldolase/(4S)-4-hydroxy-2-oxoglutarate aldolase